MIYALRLFLPEVRPSRAAISLKARFPISPENARYQRELQKIHARLGHTPAAPAPAAPAAAEAAAFREELLAPPPAAVEQPLTPQEREALNNAITESDLYVTYRQTGKAIAPLEALLPRLPANIALNERLLDLYEQAGQYGRAAERCEVLRATYAAAPDHERAASYTERLAALRQRAAGTGAPVAAPSAEAGAVAGLPEFSMGPATAEFPVEQPAPPASFPPPRLAGEAPSEVREVDLSDWESMLAGREEPATAPAPAPSADLAQGARQIEAYLQAGQIAEATTALSELQERFGGAPELDTLAERVTMAAMGLAPAPASAGEAAAAEPISPPPAEAAPTVQEFQFGSFGEPPVSPAGEVPLVWPEPPAPAEAGAQQETVAEQPAGEAPPPLEIPVEPVMREAAVAPAEPALAPAPPPVSAAPEFELHLEEPRQAGAEESFELALEEEPSAPPAAAPSPAAAPPPAAPPVQAPAPAEVAATAAPAASAGIEDLLGVLEEGLAEVGPGKAAPAAAPAPPPVAAPPAAPPAKPPVAAPAAPPPAAAPEAAAGLAGGLADVFADFKKDMEEEAGSAEADIETHFNMGVAYKEMRLFDEAIGELQKAYQIAERTKSYGNYVRCCTLLAHCFTEKGLPLPAVRWLENALKAPALEHEDILALRYEIGAAYQAAGNGKAALDSFMEVYALNIDYRDVAERIRELQGK